MTRVLVVDDNEDNLYYLRSLLGAHGYEIDTARHGAEALRKARSVQPDVVVSDLLMPVMDGFDATLEIKKFSDTPIIALTAAAKLEIMERIDECEFEGFVAKPIDANELLKKVKEVTLARNYKA